MHPDVQDLFLPFRGMTQEDLKSSARLREHGLRVMGTVEKCLARLDDPQKLEEMLHELGQKHVMFNTKVDYIDVSLISFETRSSNDLSWLGDCNYVSFDKHYLHVVVTLTG